MQKLWTVVQFTWVVACMAAGGMATAQAQERNCVVCFGCGMNPYYARQSFAEQEGLDYSFGATPQEAVAKHVSAQLATGIYCSYSVTLDGSAFDASVINLRVHGAVQRLSFKSPPSSTTPCSTVIEKPYKGPPPSGWFEDDVNNMANNAAVCWVPSIGLSGPTETKPRGTSGWRELMLTARVTQGNTPVAGKAVTFKLVPAAAPDGHEHGGLADKPAGSIANGGTNAAGEYKVPYFPSEFAGFYTIEASCEGCGSPARLHVAVRVPDLVEVTASTAHPPSYTLVGETTTHPKSHYFSEAGRKALQALILVMQDLGWINPGLNDSSLVWGGRFDIAGRWGGSHAGHREGDEVDISFYRPAGVSLDVRTKTYRKLAAGKRFESPQTLWHQNDNPETGSSAHFHIYLLGQKSSFITKY
jgi:hypothetical protein